MSQHVKKLGFLLMFVAVLLILFAGPVSQTAEAGDSPGTLAWRWNVRNTAFSWLGVKYVLGGSSRQGADCAGLVRGVYNEASAGWASYTYRNVTGLAAKCVGTNNPQMGDLVLFWNKNPALGPIGWNHVGIYIGNGYFIHDNAQTGYTMVDNLYSANPAYGNSRFWVNNFNIYFGVYTVPDQRIN